jgi:peptide/nickel transport system substrate-binding protein
MGRASRLGRVAAALLLAACGGGDAGEGGGSGAAVGPPQTGGTATIGILVDFSGFNPVTNTSILTDEVIKQMLFTPLVQYDSALNVQPYLAESWELSDSSVTFRLRQDVRWHDGQPVTAEDVKFTFDLAKNPETASLLGSAYMNMVESATVVDPRTIRFDFVAPHAQALDGFWWAPLPRHLLQNVAPGQLLQAPYNSSPVGSGPFRFVSWDRNQRLVLEADTAFPAALGGRPQLDRVVFRIIPEATTMVTELLNGSADVIGWTLLPDQARQIEGQRGVELRHFPSREFTYLGWNNQREPFTDARVRRALAMSLNRAQMIEALLQGYGVPAHGMVPPWSPMYTEAQPLPYDTAAAKRLLAEAGWTDSNRDGILDKGGRPLRFTLLVNATNRLHQDLATVMQQQLRQAGVDVVIRTSEFQTLLQQHKAREYDAVISNWTLDTFKVDPTPLFTCAEARTAGSANRAGYCNPQADQLIQQGLRTTDAGQAKQTWAQFSQVLQQDQPITFLYWTEDLAGVGPRLQGVQMDVRSKLANAPRWWIPADRRR